MKLFGKLDKTVFYTAGILYLGIFLYIFLAPEQASQGINALVDFTLNSLGFVYILIYAIVLIAFLLVGMGKYGKIRLGKDTDRPEFSFFSWMGLLFGAGMGVGLVFYGVAEPVSHYMVAPFTEGGTVQAAQDAMRITFFHWSFLPWGMYGMAGLCMAYFVHRKNLPGLVSSTFHPMLGDRITKGPGKIINALSLIAVICGVSMSFGVAGVQITSGLNLQYNLPNTFLVISIVIVVMGLISIFSATSGLAKGIKFISDSNMYIVLFFLVFAFIFGDGGHGIKVFFESIGAMLTKLPEMMFFMDSNKAVENHVGFNWVGSWTMVYWAWWVAFAPFIAGFLSKISKGRTVREFVLACAFVPSILCCLWFALFGGQAISLDLFQNTGIGDAVMANTENSLFLLLETMPISALTIPLAMVLITTLIVTSVNSGTIVAGQFSIQGTKEPNWLLRAFWGVFIILNALAFIYIGGLDTLRSIALLLAFPVIIITLLMVINLFMALRKEEIQEKAQS